jgi:ribonuclease E
MPGEAPAPRRRSTVRERAPVAAPSDTIATAIAVAEVTPPPEAAPEEAPAASDDGDKPRKTGWWGRRLLGGDKD